MTEPWTRQRLLKALDAGHQKIRFTNLKPTLHLIGVGMTGALVKNIHGHMTEQPLENIESVTK